MKHTTKKAVSLLLSVLMVFTLVGAVSLGAFAEEPCDHLYGTTGDARFTCVKCGAVDEDLYDAVYCKQDDGFTAVWSEDFETDPIENGWTFVDMDDDGKNWEWWTERMRFHSGSGLIASASYDDDGALTPDNWAVSPAVEIPDNAVLSFWVVGQDASWAEEHYQVYVGEGGALADLEPVTEELVSSAEYENIRVDLAEWAGKSVHIGFRHFNVSDMFMLNIDDVEIGTVPEASEPVEHTFDDDYTCLNCGYVNTALKNAAVCAVGQIDFFEDFETDPEENGWEFLDEDGDGNTWYWLDASKGNFVTHSGGGILTSASYAGEPLNPDNTAISPEFTISEGARLSVWYVGQDPNYAEEHIAVSLMLGDDIIDLSDELTASGEYQEFTCDLSDYAGQSASVVIRHYDTYDMFRVNIDDVFVGSLTEIADAHDFEATWDWAEDYASCVATLTCLNCGQTHTFAADVAFDGDTNTYTASVVYDGATYTDVQTVTPACEHVYDDQGWEPFDENQHVRYCTICGEGAQYEDHDVILKGAGDATCTLDGYTGDEFCSVCNAKLSEGEIIPATGHNYDGQDWEPYDETNHVRYCTICEEPEYEEHDVILKGNGDATCTLDGYTGDEFCSVCNAKLSEGEIIPATGHTPERVGAVEATATENGYTGDLVCAVCGELLEEGSVIPATGEPEPEEPAAGPCPYCGETHDNTTLSGWWTELLHHLLFIIQRIAFWWA